MKGLRHMLVMATAVLAISVPSLVFAGRPFSTDDADPVDEGVIEFETGTDFFPKTEEVTTYFSLKHGIGGRMDIGFDFSYLYPEVEGLNIGMKFKLLEGEHDRAALTCGFPTGGAPFDLNLILAENIPPLDIYVNIGEVSSFEGLSFGLSPQMGFFEDKLTGGLEVTGSYQEDELSLETLFGISYSPSENLALDLGLGTGLRNAEGWRLTFGATYDF